LPRWNIFVDFPYEYRVQRVNEESPHHQNETFSHPGDLHLRTNYLWKNTVFGPGWRIYTGGGVIIPTGTSYPRDVFAPAADTIPHSHIVSGGGNYQVSLHGEMYYRSEFPVAPGMIFNVRFPLWNPENEYSPGTGWSLLWVNYVQSIRILSSIPRVDLLVSGQSPESWGNYQWPNSGGWKVDAQVGWITELSNFWTGVVGLSFPVYRNFLGSQLSGLHLNVTVRYLF